MRFATRTLLALLSTVLLLAAGLAAQKTDSAQALLRTATDKATVDGDCNGAIKQFQTIVDRFKTERPVVATALVQMAECYQKMGDVEAMKIYQRVVREFADQKEAAAQARNRLTERAGAATSSATVVRQVWTGPEVDLYGAPTPDGRYFAFTDGSTDDIAIRDLATGEKRRLTNNNGSATCQGYGQSPVVSSDGTQIAYAWLDCVTALFELRVAFLTGSPTGSQFRVVVHNEDVRYLQPFGWSADGKQILTLVVRGDQTTQIALIAVPDGGMRILKSLEWRYPLEMGLSPDGRYVAYDAPLRRDSADRDIFVLAVDGRQEIPLVQHPAIDYGPVWTPDGKGIVFASDRRGNTGLWAIQVAEGKPIGTPELVKPDMGNVSPFGFSRDGSYYYGVRTGTEDVYVAELNPETAKLTSAPIRLTERLVGSNLAGVWSPDGRRFAYVSRRGPLLEGPGAMAVVIRSLDTGQERDFVSTLGFDRRRPVVRWFPDSQSLLITASDNQGRWLLHRMDTQTGATMRVSLGLGRPGFVFQPPVLSPDGRTVYYLRQNEPANGEPGPTQSLMTNDIATGQEQEIFRNRPATPGLLVPALSGDGKQLAFVTNEENPALVVMPAGGGTPREVFRAQGDAGQVMRNGLAWTHDDRFIVFVRQWPDDRSGARGTTFAPGQLWRISPDGGQPERLLSKEMDGLSFSFPNVAPDGRRLAFTAGRSANSEIWMMQNFLPAANTKK